MKICVLPGDGIGPEVTQEAVTVIRELVPQLEFVAGDIGYESYLRTGTALPPETIDKVSEADATLFGAVTTPPDIPHYSSAIITLRRHFNLYANVRPCKNEGIDLTIVRENTEGLYSGVERVEDSGNRAITERIITRYGSERIIRYAFKLARKRGKSRVTVVHKANVLRESCGLFRRVAQQVSKEFPDITMNELLVDACAMHLIKNPQQFDIIVTTNLFGDILSDEASMLTGGLGVACSANIGEDTGIFEPVHGSAPKYVGTHKINPMAAILSTALLLEHLNKKREADIIRNAVEKCIKKRQTTPDLGGTLSTQEVTKAVLANLQAGKKVGGALQSYSF